MLQKDKVFGLTNSKQDTTKLSRAKNHKIESLYIGTLKKTGKVLMGKCLFHKERTGSLAIYPATNTWHCFANCGGGDAIDFYMKLHNVDFKEALEALI